MPPKKKEKIIITTPNINYITDTVLEPISNIIDECEEALKTLNENIEYVREQRITIDENGDISTQNIDKQNSKKIVDDLIKKIGKAKLEEIVRDHLNNPI